VREEAATVCAGILWGSSFVVIKYGLEFSDPFIFLFLRFLFALAVVVCVYLLLGRKPDWSLFQSKLMIALGLTNTAGYLFEYMGMTFITATKSAFLVNLGVIFVALFSHYFLKEELTRRKGVAILVSVCGVFLLTTKGSLGNVPLGDIAGNAISLSSALMWALVMILNKKAVGRTNLLDLTFVLEAYTLIFTMPFLAFSHFRFTDSVIFLGAITAVCYSVIPFLLWSYGLKKISATSSSIILLLEIFCAALFAFLFLSERLTPQEIGGGILILGAIYLATRE
jgi:drug/metabolite transporter (DMT)-like permease